MRKKETFIVRNVGGSNIMVPIGETSKKFSGLITANETAAFIWEHIERAQNIKELAQLLCEEFEVTFENALNDCTILVENLKKAGWIEE